MELLLARFLEGDFKKNMEPVFNQASMADVSLLTEMMREFYACDGLAFDEASARAALQEILNDGSLGEVYLIALEGKVVGYLVLTLGFSLAYHGRDAFVDEIYVREEYRGQGIGQKGLQFIENACQRLGVRALHLEVGLTNTRAQSLYRRTGFVEHKHYLMSKWMKVKR